MPDRRWLALALAVWGGAVGGVALAQASQASPVRLSIDSTSLPAVLLFLTYIGNEIGKFFQRRRDRAEAKALAAETVAHLAAIEAQRKADAAATVSRLAAIEQFVDGPLGQALKRLAVARTDIAARTGNPADAEIAATAQRASDDHEKQTVANAAAITATAVAVQAAQDQAKK